MRRSSKLLAILRVAPFRTALRNHGVAAAVEHAAVLGKLRFRTVVDVGANRGQFSLFARHSFPEANIVALEPLSGPAARFQRVFEGDDRVTLHRAALGRQSGSAVIHVSAHDDSSSLLPITAKQSQLFRGTEEVRTETVRVGTLDEFLSPETMDDRALLKLDVQGFELEALRGCGDLLDRFSHICAEGSFVELYEGQALAVDVIEWLRARGFELECVYGTVSDDMGRAIQADMLFTRTPR